MKPQKNKLLDAIQASDLEGVKRALDSGASAGSTYRFSLMNCPAVVLAAERGPAELVGVLLEAGADPNVRAWVDDFNGITEEFYRNDHDSALMSAAARGHSETVQLLLDHGADVDVGATVVAAIRGGHRAIVEQLIGAGAELSPEATNSGTSPLGAAARQGQIDLMEWLYQRGARFAAERYELLTARRHAKQNEQYEVLAWFDAKTERRLFPWRMSFFNAAVAEPDLQQAFGELLSAFDSGNPTGSLEWSPAKNVRKREQSVNRSDKERFTTCTRRFGGRTVTIEEMKHIKSPILAPTVHRRTIRYTVEGERLPFLSWDSRGGDHWEETPVTVIGFRGTPDELDAFDAALNTAGLNFAVRYLCDACHEFDARHPHVRG